MKPPTLIDLTEGEESDFLAALIGGVLCVFLIAGLAMLGQALLIIVRGR